MKRSTRQFFLLTFFSSLLMTQAFAQVGNIRGKVTDTEGNPIEGVTIRIEGMEVARKYTVETDAKGEFYHGGVTRQGNYRVIAQKTATKVRSRMACKPPLSEEVSREWLISLFSEGRAVHSCLNSPMNRSRR